MPLCQITLRCKGNKSPFNGCFRHPEMQGLSIKNYDYKQINAWQVFPLSVTKIRIISHNATFFAIPYIHIPPASLPLNFA